MEKTYELTREVRINKEFAIPKGAIVKIDWNGYDGATWEAEVNGVIHRGQPWFDMDAIREVSEGIM